MINDFTATFTLYKAIQKDHWLAHGPHVWHRWYKEEKNQTFSAPSMDKNRTQQKRKRRDGRKESEGGWRCRACVTFPTQQEVHAKDRNPQADRSACCPATSDAPLLACLRHLESRWFAALEKRPSSEDEANLNLCTFTLRRADSFLTCDLWGWLSDGTCLTVMLTEFTLKLGFTAGVWIHYMTKSL